MELLHEREWMRQLALKLAGDGHDAQDLEQSTWLKLIRRPPRAGVPLRSWIATVMVNTARNTHRGTRRRLAREESWGRDRPTLDPGELGLESDVLDALQSAVEQLEAPYQQTISLRFYGQLSPKQIGESLGIPAATVRTRLRRALQQLRGEMDRLHAGDRRAWSAALLAWAGRGDGAGLGSGAGPGSPDVEAGSEIVASAGTSGAVTMGWLGLLTVVSLAWLVTWLDWGESSHGAVAIRRPLTERQAGTAALLDFKQATPRALRPLLAGPVDSGAAAASAEATPARPPGLEIRIEDALGRALQGQVMVVHREAMARWSDAAVSDFPTYPTGPGDTAFIPRSDLAELDGFELRAIVPGFGTRRLQYGGDGDEALTIRVAEGVDLILEMRGEDFTGQRLRLSSGMGRVQDKALEREPGLWEVRWTGLGVPPEGAEWVVEWLCPHVGDARVLASWTVWVEPGGVVVKELDPPEPEVELPTGSLQGRIELPREFLAGAEAILLAVGEAEHHQRMRVGGIYVTLPATTEEVSGTHGALVLAAEDLPVGDYEVWVTPVQALLDVRIEEGRTAFVDARLEAPAELWVDVRTREGQSLTDVELGYRQVSARGRLMDVATMTRQDAALPVRVEPGALLIEVEDPETPWYGKLVVDALPGPQRVTLEVEPVTRVPLRFVLDGETMHRSRYSRLEEVVPPPGRPDGFWSDRTRTHDRVDVVGAGVWTLNVRAMKRFRPVAPIRVEVLPGQQVVDEVVIVLERVD